MSSNSLNAFFTLAWSSFRRSIAFILLRVFAMAASFVVWAHRAEQPPYPRYAAPPLAVRLTRPERITSEPDARGRPRARGSRRGHTSRAAPSARSVGCRRRARAFPAGAYARG